MSENKWFYDSKWIVVLILLIAAVLFWKSKSNQSNNIVNSAQNVSTQKLKNEKPEIAYGQSNINSIPNEASKVFEYALANNGLAQKGFRGNTPFMNRGGNLPKTDANGNRLKYKEYDVFPLKHGKNRGPNRVVIDNNYVAYYTKDHYNHFIKIQR